MKPKIRKPAWAKRVTGGQGERRQQNSAPGVVVERNEGWETIEDPVLLVVLTRSGAVHIEGPLPTPGVVQFLRWLSGAVQSGEVGLHKGCEHDHGPNLRPAAGFPQGPAPSPYL